MSFSFKVLWVKCQYLSLQQRKKPLRSEVTKWVLKPVCFLIFFFFSFPFPWINFFSIPNTEEEKLPSCINHFFRVTVWSPSKIPHVSAFCSENLMWSCTRKEPCVLQGHSNVPWHFLVEKIQKLSVYLLTARRVLSKKAQQSFLCMSSNFHIPYPAWRTREDVKSLDPHFVLLHIVVFSFSLSPVLFFPINLVCRGHKADNLETDPDCALQTKGSLSVILASCALSICSTANFSKAQNSPVESKGWQTVLL